MLEKLTASFKNSLPESFRKKTEEENDEEALESSEENDEEATGENEPAVDKKKKQVTMLIRVGLVLVIGYLALDQFVLKNDNQDTEVAVVPVKRKPRKKPVEPPAEVVKAEAKVADSKASESALTDKKNDDIKPTEAKTEEHAVATELAIEAAPEAPVENINIAEKPKEDKKEEDVAKVVVSEKQVDESIDSLIDAVDGTEKPKVAEVVSEKKEVRLEDKIVADDIYTPVPAYDKVGRGLVYNCTDKFWACVDKLAYVDCNKNMKWNKSHGKPIECAVQNVYSTDDDCTIIQKYNVSSNKETAFCQ